MTDNEISRRLALAIGWEAWQVGADDASGAVWICTEPESNTGPAKFMRLDYRDPAVIWSIAERFNAFPRASAASGGELWFSRVRGPIQVPMLEFSKANTAAKAVALAVIKAKESKS